MYTGAGIEIWVRKFKHLNVKFKGIMIYTYKTDMECKLFCCRFLNLIKKAKHEVAMATF